MNFDNYIFRSHYQGDLVSVPKGLTENQLKTLEDYRERARGVGRGLTEKQEATWHDLEDKLVKSKQYKLSTTAKKKCTQIAMAEYFGRQPKHNLKTFAKGLEVEKLSRDLISRVTGEIYVKSKERRHNDWVSGLVDIEPTDIVIDIKSSYDLETFNNHILEEYQEYFFRQGDCYMELWHKKMFLLAFVLIDTPFRLIDDEIQRMDWKTDIMTLDGNIREERIEDVVNLVKLHLYTREGLENYCKSNANVKLEWFDDFIEIPEQARVHFVEHKFDPVRIEQRNECLTLCRKLMNTIRPMNNYKI